MPEICRYALTCYGIPKKRNKARHLKGNLHLVLAMFREDEAGALNDMVLLTEFLRGKFCEFAYYWY